MCAQALYNCGIAVAIIEWYTFELSIWLQIVTYKRTLYRLILSTFQCIMCLTIPFLSYVEYIEMCVRPIISLIWLNDLSYAIIEFLYQNNICNLKKCLVATWRRNSSWAGRWYLSLFAFVAAYFAEWFCYACQQAWYPVLQWFDKWIAQVSGSGKQQNDQIIQ